MKKIFTKITQKLVSKGEGNKTTSREVVLLLNPQRHQILELPSTEQKYIASDQKNMQRIK
jgi:predicted secreted protein